MLIIIFSNSRIFFSFNEDWTILPNQPESKINVKHASEKNKWTSYVYNSSWMKGNILKIKNKLTEKFNKKKATDNLHKIKHQGKSL